MVSGDMTYLLLVPEHLLEDLVLLDAEIASGGSFVSTAALLVVDANLWSAGEVLSEDWIHRLSHTDSRLARGHVVALGVLVLQVKRLLQLLSKAVSVLLLHVDEFLHRVGFARLVPAVVSLIWKTDHSFPVVVLSDPSNVVDLFARSFLLLLGVVDREVPLLVLFLEGVTRVDEGMLDVERHEQVSVVRSVVLLCGSPGSFEHVQQRRLLFLVAPGRKAVVVLDLFHVEVGSRHGSSVAWLDLHVRRIGPVVNDVLNVVVSISSFAPGFTEMVLNA